MRKKYSVGLGIGIALVCVLVFATNRLQLKGDLTASGAFLQITSPAAGGTVSGTGTLSVNTNNNAAIRSVEYQISGKHFAGPTYVGNFSYTFDSTMLSDGDNTFQAIGRDINGNVIAISPSVKVSIRNFQTSVHLLSPNIAQPLSGMVTWQVSASVVETGSTLIGSYYIDGVAEQIVSLSPFTWQMDTTKFSNGTHTMLLVITDATSVRPFTLYHNAETRVTFTVNNPVKPINIALNWYRLFLNPGEQTTLVVHNVLSDRSKQPITPAAPVTRWNDAFSSATASQWTFQHGNWTQANGILQQTADATDIQAFAHPNGTVNNPLFADTANLSNEITARVRLDTLAGNTLTGIGFRSTESQNTLYGNTPWSWEYFMLNGTNPYECVQFRRGVNGNIFSLDYGHHSYAFTCVSGVWYRMRFRVVGNTMFGNIWEDGSPEPSGWMFIEKAAVPLSLHNAPLLVSQLPASFDDVQINAAPLTFFSANSTVASVDPNIGRVTGVNRGATTVTAMAAGIGISTVDIRVTPDKSVFAHLAKSGKVLLTYDQQQSQITRSLFGSAGPHLSSLMPYFHDASLNALEAGFYGPIGVNADFEAWKVLQKKAIDSLVNYMKANSLRLIVQADNEVEYDLKNMVLNPLSRPAYQYALGLLRDSGIVMGIEARDEASLHLGGLPRAELRADDAWNVSWWNSHFPGVPLNAISTYMEYVHSVPNHTPITWPIFFYSTWYEARGWFDSFMSDYATLFWSSDSVTPDIHLETPMSAVLHGLNLPFYNWMSVLGNRDMPLQMLVGLPGTGYIERGGDHTKYDPHIDNFLGMGSTPESIPASILYGIAHGAAGFRSYTFLNEDMQDMMQNAQYGDMIGNGTNPTNAFTDYWQAMASGFRLLDELEKDFLQPQMNAPSLGQTVLQGGWLPDPRFTDLYTSSIVTGVREGAFSRVFVATNFLDEPQTVTIDLSPYRYAGGPAIVRYHIVGSHLSSDTITPADSDTVTLQTGEGIVYIFHKPSATDSTVPSIRFVSPLPNSTIPGDSFTFTLSASDDTAVDHIDLLIDGKPMITLTQAPYSVNFNTEGLKPGIWHGVTATAYDSRGNHSTAREAIFIPVRPVPDLTIDNADPGYSETGTGWSTTSAYPPWCPGNGTMRQHLDGNGADTAQWTFRNLKPGKYTVLVKYCGLPATWYAHNAPYTVYDGNTPVLSATLDQGQNSELYINEFKNKKAIAWDSLGDATITGDTLKVVLSDNVTGYLFADAVRLVPAAVFNAPQPVGASSSSSSVSSSAPAASYPCVNPQTQISQIGLKGIVPVHLIQPFIDCATLSQSKLYFLYTKNDQTTMNLNTILKRTTDSAPAKFYLYKYSSQAGTLEAANANSPNYATRFPGKFAASPAALADTALNTSLQNFANTNGITWLPADGSANAVKLDPQSLYLIVVVEQNGATIGQ